MVYLLPDAAHTGFKAIQGFALALLITWTLVALVVLFPRLNRPTYAFAVFWKVSPAVAYGPLLYILLDTADQAKVVTVAIVCFYPLLVELIESLHRFPERLDYQADLRNCSTLSKVRAFGWAYMLEGLTRAMITACPLAVIGAIVADYVIASTKVGGIGQKILSASANSNTTLMIHAITYSTLLGFLAFGFAKIIHSYVARTLLLEKG